MTHENYMKFQFSVPKSSFTVIVAIRLHSVYAALALQTAELSMTEKICDKQCLIY